ncbi:MAG: glycosyltransferase family 4 protein [Nitrospiria bacterium]
MNKRLTVVTGSSFSAPPGSVLHSDHFKIVNTTEVKGWVKDGTFIKHLFEYDEVRLLVYRIEILLRPFLIGMALRFLSHDKCYIEDEKGNRRDITLWYLISLFIELLTGALRSFAVLRRVKKSIWNLSNGLSHAHLAKKMNLSYPPVYLRTDLWFGIKSGGSVGHIAGVLNHLDQFCGKPLLISTDVIPTVRKDIETQILFPDNGFWGFQEIPYFAFNETVEKKGKEILKDRLFSFIYQRYSLNNFSGLALANHYHVPFVLEFNGSEIWVNKNWGCPLKYELLSEKIEWLNLKGADLIVVVSQVLKNDLTSRGIQENKILANPNGVDTDRYSPMVDGSRIREKFCFKEKIVIGFIGTFGKWHGAEVLTEAYGKLLEQFPEYSAKTMLFMIGDGVSMPLVKRNIARHKITDNVILAGLIAQEEGPKYLAACDILASPHVPNSDGTPFFGSPTKLFEYMAMGKGIVASDLDQIGEILKHDHTAWMVKPGDAESLMLGLKTLVDDEQTRKRLGMAARQEVVVKYTWKEHTRKIVEKLREKIEKEF